MRDRAAFGAAASGWGRLSALAGVLMLSLLSLLSLLPPPQPASHETSGAPSRANDTRLEYWF
jgi:hypothetical protein